MSSIIYSQGVVLATAVAVSGTLIFFSIFREKNFPVPPTQFSGKHEDSAKLNLRPCISSDGKRKEKRKKRVRFAESVKESKMNKNGVMMMPLPANRMALYTGILKSRVQFME